MNKLFSFISLMFFLIGLTAIGGLSLIGCDPHSLLATIGSISVVGHVAKFGVAFPLVFHYLGGLRHLIWDRNPDMLENDQVEQSSKLLIGGATLISVGVALL